MILLREDFYASLFHVFIVVTMILCRLLNNTMITIKLSINNINYLLTFLGGLHFGVIPFNISKSVK